MQIMLLHYVVLQLLLFKFIGHGGGGQVDHGPPEYICKKRLRYSNRAFSNSNKTFNYYFFGSYFSNIVSV